MKNILKICLGAVLLMLSVNLAYSDGTKEGLELELKQLSVSITSTEIHNSSPTFSSARVTGDSQTAIKANWILLQNILLQNCYGQTLC